MADEEETKLISLQDLLKLGISLDCSNFGDGFW